MNKYLASTLIDKIYEGDFSTAKKVIMEKISWNKTKEGEEFWDDKYGLLNTLEATNLDDFCEINRQLPLEYEKLISFIEYLEKLSKSINLCQEVTLNEFQKCSLPHPDTDETFIKKDSIEVELNHNYTPGLFTSFNPHNYRLGLAGDLK